MTEPKSMTKHGAGRPVVITYEPSPVLPQLLRVSRPSDMSGRFNIMDLPITEQHLSDWLQGDQLIQQVMPHLDKEQREFLISGTTQAEWDAVFGKEDDHDDNT